MTERRLLFVGSGLSSALDMPSWTALLKQVAAETLPWAVADRIARHLATPGHEYDAADEIAGALGNRDRLEQSITKLIVERQTRILKAGHLSRWTSLLQKAGKCGIITTNWDTLLQDILPSYQQLIWPKDAALLAGLLRDEQPFVLYLHGNVYRRPLTITKDDRLGVQDTLKSESFRLATFLAIHTLIVIGSSFSDPHLNDLYLAASLIAGADSRIRVVLNTKEEADRFSANHRVLAQYSVEVSFADHSEFRKALTDVVDHYDPSVLLSELRLIQPRRADRRLYEIVSRQPYNFESVSHLQKAIKAIGRLSVSAFWT